MATVVSDLEKRALAKVKGHLFAYFLIGQVLLQLDKNNIGFANLTMRSELLLTSQAFGLAAGIFALGSVAVQVPASRLFEIVGARRFLTATMLLWGCTCMAEAFVTNATQLVILRFLLGVFEAGFFPALTVLVSIWFRGSQHGRAFGVLQLGTATAGIIGGPFAGWVLGQTFLELSGWRNLFLWEGAATVCFAFLGLLIVYDGPRNTSWLTRDEQEFLSGYLAEGQLKKSTHSPIEKAGVLDALKDWRILVLILASASAGWVFATFAFFSPTLLRAAGTGLDVQTVGFLSMGPYVIQAGVALTWGAHSDKHDERHWHLVGPLLVGAIGILLYPVLSSQPILAMLCLVMVQGALAAFLVTFWPTVNMVMGRKSIPRAVALIQIGSQTGGFVAPIVFGWLMDLSGGNTSLGLYEAAGVLLCNFVLMNVFFFHYKGRQKQLSLPA